MRHWPCREQRQWHVHRLILYRHMQVFTFHNHPHVAVLFQLLFAAASSRLVCKRVLDIHKATRQAEQGAAFNSATVTSRRKRNKTWHEITTWPGYRHCAAERTVEQNISRAASCVVQRLVIDIWPRGVWRFKDTHVPTRVNQSLTFLAFQYSFKR